MAFSVGLVGFFAFSAAYGDGLEVTMEKAGLNEVAPVFSGILSYGDSYFAALVAGLVGFAITVGAVLLYWRARGRSSKKEAPQD